MANFDSLIRKLDYIEDNLVDNVTDEVVTPVKQAKRLAQHYIDTQDAIASYFLRTNINVWHGDGFIVYEADVPYAAYVEHGTGIKGGYMYKPPSYTPRLVGAIWWWMQMKQARGRWDYSRGFPTYQKAENIALHISQFGTEPQPYFYPAWNSIKPKLNPAAKKGIRKTLRWQAR